MENNLIDEKLTTQENTPTQNISGSDTWANVANFRYFGSYLNGGDVDAAVKDILVNRLPLSQRGAYQPIFASFVCNSVYSMIIQSFTSKGTYSSAIVFSYADDDIKFYQLKSGTLYKMSIKATRETIL